MRRVLACGMWHTSHSPGTIERFISACHVTHTYACDVGHLPDSPVLLSENGLHLDTSLLIVQVRHAMTWHATYLLLHAHVPMYVMLVLMLHMFNIGHGDDRHDFNDSQRSPVFIQWIDAVYQGMCTCMVSIICMMFCVLCCMCMDHYDVSCDVCCMMYDAYVYA